MRRQLRRFHIKKFPLLSLLIVFALLLHASSNILAAESNSPTTDIVAAPIAVGVTLDYNFWPLPTSNGQAYWWYFAWADGNNYPCSGSIVPPKKVGIAAQNLNDGAFQNEDLVSISFFKDADCTYWKAGAAQTLRWYSLGFKQGSPDKYLSFRGSTKWCIDRALGNTLFKRGSSTEAFINDRYTYTCSGGSPSHPMLSGDLYGNFVNNGIPSYATVPDHPRTAVIDYTTYYTGFGGGATAWNNLRNCNPTGACPGGSSASVRWYVSWKEVAETGYTFAGKKVQYAGFSETPTSGGVGACEEWWFARDIGPIYIVDYPAADYTTCTTQYLRYGTSGFSTNVGTYADSRTPVARGYLWPLTNHYCVSGTCSVQY